MAATLEEELARVFREKGLTLATAESCTGGLLAGRITDIAGSSDYMRGGVVSYANEVKEALLGVESDALAQHGAVSDVVARQMARGVRERLGTDVGISITGVAGPGGGTSDKPVGLVWIGLSDAQGAHAERFHWQGSRAENRALSVEAALKMLVGWAQQQAQP